MQRCSESIGAIAAALAKAQAELTNPEKSLIATIRASHPRENDQTFRYAALSSGLDIVRKTLGGHEIATVQTTAIDKEVGLIHLTTTLAHSSGEWLSSEWPVCAITETTAPRRMGAALTYARRYALFTLVGIAGEDDVDAPDLSLRVDPISRQRMEGGGAEAQTKSEPAPLAAAMEESTRRESQARRQPPGRVTRTILGPEESEALRDRLIAEIAGLQTSDEAAVWVHKNLPGKNMLGAADADLVEASFRERLTILETDVGENEVGSKLTLAALEHESEGGSTPSVEPFAASVEESAVVPAPSSCKTKDGCRLTAKTIRLRDKEHCKYVATQPCIVCGRTPSETHHLRFAQPRALGAEGERRIHGPNLPHPSSRVAPIWR